MQHLHIFSKGVNLVCASFFAVLLKKNVDINFSFSILYWLYSRGIHNMATDKSNTQNASSVDGFRNETDDDLIRLQIFCLKTSSLLHLVLLSADT